MLNVKDQIQTQIINTEYLLSLVEDHPLMSYSLKKKIEELNEKLESLPEQFKEAKVILLFSGGAVKGSKGIKANFISQTLKPFQELIKSQTSIIRFGKLGKRGKSKSSNFSELYLTALPTGSFGVELSQIDSDELFAEEDVSNAIDQVMTLIESSTKSDDEFENAIENMPPRNLNNLKTFLKSIDDEHSILKMESGTHILEISEENIHLGFMRVSSAIREDDTLHLDGTLRGVLLESGKFEFVDIDGYKFSGFLSPDISEDLIVTLLNVPSKIELFKSKINFKSGNEKVAYELLDISQR